MESEKTYCYCYTLGCKKDHSWYNPFPQSKNNNASIWFCKTEGVYYFFRNMRLGVDNLKSLNGCSNFIANLDYKDSEYYFKKVLELNIENGWLETDKLFAYTDNDSHPWYIYESGNLTHISKEMRISLSEIIV